ncbi:unnamed protein product [Rotaria sordida]|uniref:Uncharacterized protein n=2 Tax=Rotaria sordida TaxID=392033 RepID=A0A819JCD3_9BILA|nr:unnamed protein product [Rotaria sordida]CAF1066505.1 unnamed protein product [Rotaria sordida]CAF3930531.1 unnamed protein product [Rotaria sordida]
MINSEDFIIVWLDENQDKTTDYFDTRQHLRYVIQYVRTFNDADECIDFITSQQTNNIFFLVSETLGKIVIPHVHELSQIALIYILGKLDGELFRHYSKVAGVFIDNNRLVSKLVVDIARYTHTTISISFLDKNAIKSIRDLSKEHASFMWFQLLIEMLLKMDQMDIAKNEMIHECLSQYEDDQVEQKKIEDFQNNYNETKAIWWYTRDCFLYRLLNKALRTENIDIIFKFRFFIKELFHQLNEASNLYTEELIECDIETFSLYRGQNITFNELQKLKQCINGLISFNTFLSTTNDRDVAVVYAGDGSGTPEIESVLFEMIINININKIKPFANIQNLSYFQDENEILDEDEQLNEVFDYLKKQIHETTDIFTLGSFLIQMGEFNKAETYYIRLLKETPSSNSLLCATIYNQLGLLHQRKCDYLLALEQYQQALEIFSQYPTIDNEILSKIYDNIATVYDDLDVKETINDDLSLGITYSNIAVTYDQLGDYENAMTNHEKSLEILSRLPTYHPSLAATYGNLGSTFRNIDDNKKALEMYKRKLDIELKTLPPNHPSLASTYNNMGIIYKESEDYILALKMYQSALDICSVALISDHVNMALTYNNIANVYNETGDYNLAIDCYLKALEIELKHFSVDHIQLAVTYGNIALAYDGQRTYTAAVEHHQKALDILLNSSTVNQKELSTSYFNFGSTLKKMGNFSSALKMFEKTLEINLARLPHDHFEFVVLFNNIGLMHFNLEHYGNALENYNRAVEICFKSLPKDHNYLAQIYDNIGLIYKMADDEETAIQYFEKSFEIRSKNLPSNHPSIPIIRCMLDEARKKLEKK